MMQEARQNWHRFRRLLGPSAPVKNGLLVLTNGSQVIHGAVASKDGKAARPFSDVGLSGQSESNWEVLAHKYQTASGTFVDREALLGILGDLQKSKHGFALQLKEVRRQLLQPNPQRQKLIQQFGERPVEQSWPRPHFFLNFFSPIFSELLPERKILLLVVQNTDDKQIQTLAIEFLGKEMQGFREPDWSGLSPESMDLFHHEDVNRLVIWCENHYLTPTIAFCVSQRVWEEAVQLSTQSTRSAWRYIAKQRRQREHECELLVEPEPWPLKASLQWLSFRS